MNMYQHPALIAQIQTTQKVVAITFDDGPDPLYTPHLLELFHEYNAKATFYTVGQQLEAHREVAIAAHEAGHELGNHTYSHPHLPELDREQQLSELVQTEKLLVEITGSKPLTFRPPYLEFNEETIVLIESFDYRIISAMNLGTEDWREPGVDHILNKTREHIVPGSILLFHDGFGDRSQTMEAVRILLTEYTAQGFQFVTVSDLLKLQLENNA
jgi:peptidoglycan/xylan/chitin deacetylase (PgdA/CDA1 family)